MIAKKSSAAESRFTPQHKIVMAVAAGIILLSVGWLIYVTRPREKAGGLTPEAIAFIQRARAALDDGPFDDIALLPTPDLQGLVVHGDVKTGSDLAELKKRIEALSPSLPIQYEIAVARP